MYVFATSSFVKGIGSASENKEYGTGALETQLYESNFLKENLLVLIFGLIALFVFIAFLIFIIRLYLKDKKFKNPGGEEIHAEEEGFEEKTVEKDKTLDKDNQKVEKLLLEGRGFLDKKDIDDAKAVYEKMKNAYNPFADKDNKIQDKILDFYKRIARAEILKK